jgi:hypothetical protein
VDGARVNFFEARAWKRLGLAGGLFGAAGCSSSTETSEAVGKVASALSTANVEIKVTSVVRGFEPQDPQVAVGAQFVGFNAPPGSGEAPGQRMIGNCTEGAAGCDWLLPFGSWQKSVTYDRFDADTRRFFKVSGQLLIRVIGGLGAPTFQRCFHFAVDPLTGETRNVQPDPDTCPGGTMPEAQLSSMSCSGHTCTAELKINEVDDQPWHFTFETQSACSGTGPDADCDGVIDGCVPEPYAISFHDDIAADDSLCDGKDNDCNGLVDENYYPWNSTLCSACKLPVPCINGKTVDPCEEVCKPAPTPTDLDAGWMQPAFVYDFDVGGDTLCYAPALVSFGTIGTIICSNQIGNAGSFPTRDIGTPDFLTDCFPVDDPNTAKDETAPCRLARLSVDPNGRAWASASTGVFAQVGEKLQRVAAFPASCSWISRLELVGPADRSFQGAPTARPFALCSGGLFELDLATLTWQSRGVSTRYAGTSPSKGFDLFANIANTSGRALAELNAASQPTYLATLGAGGLDAAVGGIFAIGNDFTGGRPIIPYDPARDPGLISQWTGSALAKVADVTRPRADPTTALGSYEFLSAPTTVDDAPDLTFDHQKIVEGGGAGVGGPSPAGTNDVVWVLTNTSRLYVYNLPPITQNIRDALKGDDSLPVTAFSLSAPDAAPVALCRDVTIDANASCAGTVTAAMIDAGSSDPDGTAVTVTLAHPAALRLGVNQVELIVSDGTLSSTCWSNVTLRDNTAPALTVPAAVNVKTCAYPASVSVGQATATDGCSTPVVSGRVIATNGTTLATPIPVTSGPTLLPPGTHTIEWAATDGLNTARANQTVTVGVLIESSASFLVNDRAQLKAAAGGLTALFNAGTSTTRVGNFAKSGRVLSRGPVTVLHNALVEGGITSPTTPNVAADATVNGPVTVSTSVWLPALGTLPTFPTPTGTDRIVNSGATLTLSPGSYASLTVNGSGTLVLGAGDYYFTGLTVNSLSTVRVTSTTRIFVKTTLALRSSFTASGHVQAIYLGFAGAAADMMAPFEGTLLAPAAHVYFGSGVGMTFTGSFFARDIELNPDTVMSCRAN